MPDARGRPLPSEILDALKTAPVTNWLRSFLIQTASVETIGRYPGNGSAQVDSYVYPDAADGTFPYNFDYIIPSNFQRVLTAKMSIKIRPYRSYNSFSATATGAGSAHAHSAGNNDHNHNHAITLSNGSSATAVTWGGVGTGLEAPGGGNDGGFNLNNQSVNHAHSIGNESAHTHPVSVTSTLGIFEDSAPVNPGITVSVDGSDVTSKIGGPFNADQVEIDMSQVLITTPKLWHTVALQPNQRVRITGILRIGFYVDSRLAQ